MFLHKLSTVLLAGIFLICMQGCKKTSTETLNEMINPTAVLKYSGIFMGQGGQTVSGQAQIFLESNKYSLKLANFSSSNGPDLKVYLSKADSPSEHISLGDLKSTNGNQVYDIPGSPDFTLYKYALIHCEKFNHRYGSAELKKWQTKNK